jgi:hypothetical protein
MLDASIVTAMANVSRSAMRLMRPHVAPHQPESVPDVITDHIDQNDTASPKFPVMRVTSEG